MGTGFLHVLGGALQGVGQGMAAAGEMEWRERRELALQEARGRQAIALEQAEQKNRLEVEGVRAENAKELETHKRAADVVKERELSPIRQAEHAANASVDTAEKFKVIGEQAKQDAALARIRGSIDRSNDAASQNLRNALEANDRTLVVGDDGYYRLVGNDGTSIKTTTKATAREIEGSRNTTGGSLIEELRAARGEGGATPKPAAEPRPKAPSKQPLRARENAGGTPRMATDAQATAFVNNPANKGKSFVGPDGKRYRVPE